MYKLLYAVEADNDLQAIYDYIANDNLDRAVSYLGEIEKQILRLTDFPNIGHDIKYNELKALGVKILPFDNYLIFYTINEPNKIINIVRVLHGSADYKRLFRKSRII